MTEITFSAGLNTLLFFGLDHGVDSVRASGVALVPFLVTEDVNGERSLHRYTADTLEEAKAKAEATVVELDQTVQRYVLVYDGYLTTAEGRYDAIFARAAERGVEQGIILAQRYTPKKLLRSFRTVGNPALAAYVSDPWADHGTNEERI